MPSPIVAVVIWVLFWNRAGTVVVAPLMKLTVVIGQSFSMSVP